jgi:hypothetical protein
MINQPNIMPFFVFARRSDIEIEAELILAGQLVVDIPKRAGAKMKRQHKEMVCSIIERLVGDVRAGRMPENGVAYGWRNNFRPPNADEYINDDKVMKAWAETRLTIGVRIPRHHDGNIRIDSDMRRQLGLLDS